jgi:hypothetical protein
MCNFFSHEQDGVGNVYYYNTKMKKKNKDFGIKNPDAIKWLEKFFKSKGFKEILKHAVKQDGIALRYIPSELITKELCEIAVKQNWHALCWVPKELKTKELCEIAVKQDDEALYWVPREFCIEIMKKYKL